MSEHKSASDGLGEFSLLFVATFCLGVICYHLGASAGRWEVCRQVYGDHARVNAVNWCSRSDSVVIHE